MNRVLVNVAEKDWAVHFIAPDGHTRIGPWLLHESSAEVDVILVWGNASAEELEEHETDIRRWGTSSVVLQLTDRQLAQLIERGKGWPWNGYELRKMKEAGRYPPKRQLPIRRGSSFRDYKLAVAPASFRLGQCWWFRWRFRRHPVKLLLSHAWGTQLFQPQLHRFYGFLMAFDGHLKNCRHPFPLAIGVAIAPVS